HSPSPRISNRVPSGGSAPAGGAGPKAKLDSPPAATPPITPWVPAKTGRLLQALARGPHGSGPLLVPSPNAPALLGPHAMTAPSARSARFWASAEIAMTSVSPL